MAPFNARLARGAGVGVDVNDEMGSGDRLRLVQLCNAGQDAAAAAAAVADEVDAALSVVGKMNEALLFGFVQGLIRLFLRDLPPEAAVDDVFGERADKRIIRNIVLAIASA